ncbi:MAG: hypothetical protein HS116_16015 [Planctomycetes bacterium]|nr:hypothetical protein [Planctomycetota bacterium]
MHADEMRAKAQSLLARREATGGAEYWLRRQWKGKATALLAYAVLGWLLWNGGHIAEAYLLVGFAVGHTVRDFQWWRGLDREWLTTVEFINWNRVEEVARGAPQITD